LAQHLRHVDQKHTNRQRGDRALVCVGS
jgi:hypothetical protein